MIHTHRFYSPTSLLAAFLAVCLAFSLLPYASAAGQTLYVAAEQAGTQGAGTQENPYRGLAQAMQAAADGDTLVLTDNVMQRESSAADGFTFDKAVTIQGDSHTLTFRGSDIFFDAPVVFDSVTLNVIGDSGNANLWAQGNNLTFTNVNTKISDAQNDQRPTIYTGGKTAADNTGDGATITISDGDSENRFASLILGDQTLGSAIPATVKVLSEFATIDDGITSQTSGAVTLESHSKNVTTFTGSLDNSNETVIFDGLRSYSISLENIDNVTLRNNADITLADAKSAEISGALNVESGSILSISDTPNAHIGTLHGEGTIVLDAASTLHTDTVAGAVKIEARAWNDTEKNALLKREFFTATTVTTEPTVVVTQTGTETTVARNDNGKWIGTEEEIENPETPEQPETPDQPEETEKPDVSGLLAAINAGREALNKVSISTDGTDIAPNQQWTTQEAADAFTAILDAALDAANSGELTTAEIESIQQAIIGATETFTTTYQYGAKTDTPETEEGEQPTEGEDPSEGEQPAESETSGETEETDQPEDTGEPENSEETGKLGETNQPDHPEGVEEPEESGNPDVADQLEEKEKPEINKETEEEQENSHNSHTNTYNAAEKSENAKLPNTGADYTALLFIAFLLLLTGSALSMTRKKN